jgi:uncharacterized protein YpiB (UPF0302 family)
MMIYGHLSLLSSILRVEKEEVNMPKNKENIIDVIDILCDFAQVIKNATKEEMLTSNPDYIEKVASLKKREEEYIKVLKECPMEQRLLIQGYILDIKDKHSDEGDYFYMQGYRDCIILLKQLNLFK